MPNNDADRHGLIETWDSAPCGLLRLDAEGLITAVNAHLLARLGHEATALVGRMRWTDLLAVGSRLFYETQLAPVLELDGVLDEVMVDIRAADGSRVPALMSALRLADPSGHPAGARIALMTVPDRRAYEGELRQARADAESASAADARARRRLELLATANTALASSSDIEIALTGLARVLVTSLATWCVIYANDPDLPGNAEQWAIAHSDTRAEPDLRRLAELLPAHAGSSPALYQVLAGGDSVLLTDVSADYRRESTTSDEVRALYDAVGLDSGMVVPCTTRGNRVATVITGRAPGQPQFTADDLAVLTDLGARCGIVIDNLRRQHIEHDNSLALQQALLTAPPAAPGLEIAIRYLPASQANEVGGDWYDAFIRADGIPVVVIGDVIGHDIRAGAAMGQLRATLRTIAYTDGGTPAEILSRTDATTKALAVSTFATTLLAQIETTPDGAKLLRASSAGHPPPIIIRRDGQTEILKLRADPPLGFGSAKRHDHTWPLATGDTLLLYTDGLVERRDEDLDESIRRLATSLIDTESWTIEDLCDWSLSGRRNTRTDDIALLAFRIVGSDPP